jgi:hypothetical protein
VADKVALGDAGALRRTKAKAVARAGLSHQAGTLQL